MTDQESIGFQEYIYTRKTVLYIYIVYNQKYINAIIIIYLQMMVITFSYTNFIGNTLNHAMT